jgi:hypothetical protein
MRDIFIHNAEIMTAAQQNNAGGVTTFSWEIMSSDDLLAQAKLLRDPTGQLAVDFGKAISGFLARLIGNARNLLDIANADLAGFLNDFVLDSFSGVVNNSIEAYIRALYADNNSFLAGLDNIINTLQGKACVLFPRGGQLGDDFAPFSHLAVPSGAANIAAAARKAIGQVRPSVITNRIFLLNMEVALPIAAYSEFCGCEQEYEAAYAAGRRGMHLYEGGINGDGPNWRGLPSPNHESCWPSGAGDASSASDQF